MDEETLQELRKDIQLCSSRVLKSDCVKNLLQEYQSLLTKYGQIHQETIDDLVYEQIIQVLGRKQ
jgi:hypothetical protein